MSVMKIDVNIKNVEGKKGDRYDLSMKSYNGKIEGRVDKEDLRYLIERIDNEII